MDELERARIRVYRNDPAGPGRAARRLRSAPLRRRGRVGLPRRGAHARPEAVPARHGRVPPLAARLRARARQAAVADASARRPLGPGTGPSGRARRRRRPQRLLRPPALRFFRDARRADRCRSSSRAKASTSPRTSRATPSSTPCGRTSGTRRTSRSRRFTRPSATSPRSSWLWPSRRSPRASWMKPAATRRDRTSSRAWPRSSAAPCATATATMRRCHGRCATRSTTSDTSIRRRCPTRRPPRVLSAEPHSFCNVMTGACWDLLVALFRSDPARDRVEALRNAAATLARLAAAASEAAPSGADFFGRVARRLVRAARDGGGAPVPMLAESLVARGLLSTADVGEELAPDDGPRRLRARRRRAGAAGRAGGDRGEACRRPGTARSSRSLPAAPIARPAFSAAAEGGTSSCAGASTARPTAPRSRSRIPSPWSSRDRGCCGPRACIPRRTATPRTRAPSSVSWRAGARSPTRPRVAPRPGRLAREGKSHAVVREDDGIRRLRRVWIAEEETMRKPLCLAGARPGGCALRVGAARPERRRSRTRDAGRLRRVDRRRRRRPQRRDGRGGPRAEEGRVPPRRRDGDEGRRKHRGPRSSTPRRPARTETSFLQELTLEIPTSGRARRIAAPRSCRACASSSKPR